MTFRQTWLAVSASRSTIVLDCSPTPAVVVPPHHRCECHLEIQLGSGQEINLEEIWVVISYEPGTL